MIHVAVGIVFNSQGEILIAQRPAHKYCPFLWEFPGGKVEANEDVFAALQREFQEEIGIQILKAHSWLKHTHKYPDRVVLLDTWRVTEFSGEPKGMEGQQIRWVAPNLLDQKGMEGQQIRWVAPNLLDQFEFPEGNKVIIESLFCHPRAGGDPL